MAIESAFESLQRQLERLQEELAELRVNAEDFCPAPDGGQSAKGLPAAEPPPPVVSLADRANDLEGEIQEALAAAVKAAQAVRHPRDLAGAQLALAGVQRSLNKILRLFLTEVAAYDALHTLRLMSRKLGRAWPEWMGIIHSIVKDGRECLLEAFQGLAECWQELAEKLAANSVTVQATNIGQQITTRGPLAAPVQEAG